MNLGTTAVADTDAIIRRCAQPQQGLVTRCQLLRAGVPAHAIAYRLKRGRLRAIHRGVYQVGPVAGRYQREMAAVLSCGEGTVLSHATAAGLWDLRRPPPRGAAVHVIAPRTRRGDREGVRIHRVRSLDAEEITRHRGLPVTTPTRTLLDVAAVWEPHHLERALARAEQHRLVTLDDVRAVIERHPTRRGTPKLRSLLEMTDAPAFTRSEAEARLLDMLRRGGLPAPRVNAVIRGLEVDFLWRDYRLVVEVDGFVYHRGRPAFENDRRRDARLIASGYRVIRFTWKRLVKTPEMVLVELAQALAVHAGATGRVEGR